MTTDKQVSSHHTPCDEQQLQHHMECDDYLLQVKYSPDFKFALLGFLAM